MSDSLPSTGMTAKDPLISLIALLGNERDDTRYIIQIWLFTESPTDTILPTYTLSPYTANASITGRIAKF